MAVSNSTDFSISASGLVRKARAKLGVDASEEDLQAHELQEGLDTLNMMLKAWQADGIMYWLMTEGTLTLVQGQASYSFATGGDFTTVPFDMVDMRITRNSTDLPMVELSREEYYDLPIKDNQGYPTQWFYDRQRSSGTLYVWPAPDATAGTLKFTYRRSIMDMDASDDDIDLPQEWYNAIVWNLAEEMIPEYGPIDQVTAALVVRKAGDTYAKVQAFNIAEGEGSVMIRPGMDE